MNIVEMNQRKRFGILSVTWLVNQLSQLNEDNLLPINQFKTNPNSSVAVVVFNQRFSVAMVNLGI